MDFCFCFGFQLILRYHITIFTPFMGVEVDGWWEKATKNPEVMRVRFFTQTTSCDEETYKEVDLYFVTPRTCHLQTAIFFFKYLKIVKMEKLTFFAWTMFYDQPLTPVCGYFHAHFRWEGAKKPATPWNICCPFLTVFREGKNARHIRLDSSAPFWKAFIKNLCLNLIKKKYHNKTKKWKQGKNLKFS